MSIIVKKNDDNDLDSPSGFKFQDNITTAVLGIGYSKCSSWGLIRIPVGVCVISRVFFLTVHVITVQ